jgi:hypothetical protein
METLRSWGTEFNCVVYVENTLAGNKESSFSFRLHSVVLVQCITDYAQWQSLWKNRKWETCPILEEDRLLVCI